MNRRTWTSIVVVVGLLFATPNAFSQAHAQDTASGGVRWALWDAIGYGGLGFGLGLIAAWDIEGSGFGPPAEGVALVGASTVAGIVAGAILGRRAGRAAAEGRPVGGLHRGAAIAGLVLAGGTLGALAAVPLVDGEATGTFLGSDEQTITLLIVTGAALGTAYAWRHGDALRSTALSFSPTLDVRRGAGLRVSLRR